MVTSLRTTKPSFRLELIGIWKGLVVHAGSVMVQNEHRLLSRDTERSSQGHSHVVVIIILTKNSAPLKIPLKIPADSHDSHWLI